MKTENMGASLKKQGVSLVLVFFVILMTASARAGTQEVIAAIDAISGNARIVSQQIFDFKEPGKQEIQSSGRILVIGTPDEERGSLDGYDLLIHPDKVRAIAGQIQGIEDQGSQLGAP